MGFEPISTTAMLVAGSQLMGNAVTAQAGRQAAKATEEAGRYNEALLNRRAEENLEEMRENNTRLRKNARQVMGDARLDAGGSNVATDGSIALREKAIADRLETEILDQSRKSLMGTQDLRDQAKMTAWDAKTRAKTQKLSSFGTLLSGFGNAGHTLFR
ncbi:MAG: hypothetical protein RR553_07210 [Akkermansia sp.]